MLVVVVWLFSAWMRAWIPFWLPFALLLATEADFLWRGLRERRRPAGDTGAAPRRAPGDADADLGWGELVEAPDGLRYVPPPPRARRSRLGAVGAMAAALLLAGLFVAAFRADRAATWQTLTAAERAQLELRVSREASRIAGKPVIVRCDDGYTFTGIGSDALGVAFVGRGLALLRPSVCRTLHDVVAGDARPPDEVGEAILVLAHEAVHLAGERNEGLTDCRGLQLGVALGERLGLSRPEAARLMADRYRRSLGERSITRSSYRLPSGCREGGSLDLRPDDPVFP